MLGFINTLADPKMVGVNPELAHEHMAGLNFYHAVAQAWDAGKLFHIDLNDQKFVRFDQDLRFGCDNIKAAFFLVKFLEDVGYTGSRHFDAHAYRSEDEQGIQDFASGCMRTYLILKDKARRFKEDERIQSLLDEIREEDPALEAVMGSYSGGNAKKILNARLDRKKLARKRLPYEQLDQLTIELLLGAR